jgi:transcriptional regulator with XRE-family HTH domain
MGGPKPGDPDRLYEFGQRLREIRVERNLSQEALGELTGLHRNYIGGVERGEINLSLRKVFALAEGLKLPVSAFFEN